MQWCDANGLLIDHGKTGLIHLTRRGVALVRSSMATGKWQEVADAEILAIRSAMDEVVKLRSHAL